MARALTTGRRRIGGEQLAELGAALRFCAAALLELRGVWRHSSEVLRQTGILVMGSTLLVLALNVLFGGVCATFGSYLLRPIGATDTIGAVTSVCGRGAVVVMTGYILAAKVGCGLVAEIGSMKVSEELDALRAIGLNPMRFVVATRLAAMLLYLPPLYLAAQLATDVGAYLITVTAIGEVSQGNWEALHWALRTPRDMWISFGQVLAIGVTVVLVACRYGYTVRGGPADVGAATARSMVLNLVLVHFYYAFGITLFYGTDMSIPFGG